ncbi:hypothetical protein VQL36_12525 [Chengkuizengella sp. SCS-71B]|uniref:hypothetical protein n=1 Tax=Chengkuizengella sp. SCS-71B TaxID=3115290 RepID=UPI0032C245C6
MEKVNEIKLEMEKELQKLEELRKELNRLQDNYKEYYMDCLLMSTEVDELLNRVLVIQSELV